MVLPPDMPGGGNLNYFMISKSVWVRINKRNDSYLENIRLLSKGVSESIGNG